eukprot:TRINITY_DN7015_c0_g1_i2.p1 TRINITY_DN7015_c0_g1~~TRINITY_DN7015_c0_g1_i2.p1  ORF type:complete len:183 (-),score=38.76 TRINITY_DN7015_c0_g1_i2:2-550(-)
MEHTVQPKCFRQLPRSAKTGCLFRSLKVSQQIQNGKYKMAHQRRIGDRSQTLTRERKDEHDDFQESQRLYQLSHGDLPKFKSEFNDRTNQWRSQRAIKETKKPLRAFDDRRQPRLALEDRRHSRLALEDRRKPRMLEDGGRSRAVPSSYSRPVSSDNYRRRSKKKKYRLRGRSSETAKAHRG